MYTILFALFIIFLGFYIHFATPKITRKGHRLRKPPGTLPLIGNGIQFFKSRHELFGWFASCERQFGFETFEISVPSLPPGVVINDPRNVEHVLKNEELFTKGSFFQERSFDLFGNGIINAEGDLWKVQRKAGLRFFRASNLKTFVNDHLPIFFEETENAFLCSVKVGQVVDLEQVFVDLTTRFMGKLAYDMDMQSSESFFSAFEYASSATGRRFQNPLWKITEFLFDSRLRRALLEVKQFGHRVVNQAKGSEDNTKFKKERISEHSSTLTGSDTPSDSVAGSLIGALISDIEHTDLVADSALNFLSAGRDTTAQALTWTFYLLMRSPHVISLIRKELDREDIFSQQKELNYDVIQSNALPYVTAVFYEALRLYPPVPFEIKQCQRDSVLPDGTFLPSSTVVLWCTWAMGRSSRIWGSETESFQPERWLERTSKSLLDERPSLVTKTAFEFPVFNGGPRMCLGKKMAEFQAIYTIASLVWNYNFTAIEDDGSKTWALKSERRSRNSLTLPMEGGLPCYLRRRTDT